MPTLDEKILTRRNLSTRSQTASLPNRPRFLREISLIPTEHGFLVDGLAISYHIDIPSTAKEGFINLIRLMDGSRPMTEIRGAFAEAPDEEFYAAIAMLNDVGLLEDGDCSGFEVSDQAETLAYLRRLSSKTRPLNGPEVLSKISRSPIVLVRSKGQRWLGQKLRQILLESGFGSVREVDISDLVRQLAPTDGLAISLATGEKNRDAEMLIDRACQPFQLPWLRTAVYEDADAFDIGPLFSHRPTEPCFECFLALYDRTYTYPIVRSRNASLDWFVGFLALQLIHHLSDVAPKFSSGKFQRYTISPHASKQFHLAQMPHCPSCASGSISSRLCTSDPHTVDASLIYEEVVRAKAGQRNTTFATDKLKPSNIALTRESKQLSGGRQILLPEISYDSNLELSSLPEEKTNSTRPYISLMGLSTILKLTGGWRAQPTVDGKLSRWTASAGNLGSVEIYVIVQHIEGLPVGVFLYQPHNHSLVFVERRIDALSPEALIARSIRFSGTQRPDAVIVLTGAYQRVSRKYGPFGYRLINFDAGVAISQLSLVASSLKLQTEFASSWADDLLADQLGLGNLDEQCTGIVALYADAHNSTRAHLRRLHRGTAERSQASPDLFGEMGLQELVKYVYESSRLGEASIDDFVAASLIDSVDLLTEEAAEESLHLSYANFSGLQVYDVLSKRATVRHYADSPVKLPALRHVLSTGLRYGLERVADERLGLSLYILALRVDGLEPGVYLFDLSKSALSLVRTCPSTAAVEDLFIQRGFSTAPVCIFIAADLAIITAASGSYGHRLSLVRAGAVAQSLWHSAMALGLQGGITAGIVLRGTKELLGVDGLFSTPLLAFTMGTQNGPTELLRDFSTSTSEIGE